MSQSNDRASSPPNAEDRPRCTTFRREFFNRVGDKWTLWVVGQLAERAMRFNELQRAIGEVSQRMLTLTLRGLERDGLVSREVFPTVPPKVEYSLTPLGRTLLEPIQRLADWADDHEADIDRARRTFESAQRT